VCNGSTTPSPSWSAVCQSEPQCSDSPCAVPSLLQHSWPTNEGQTLNNALCGVGQTECLLIRLEKLSVRPVRCSARSRHYDAVRPVLFLRL